MDILDLENYVNLLVYVFVMFSFHLVCTTIYTHACVSLWKFTMKRFCFVNATSEVCLKFMMINT
jgi:hypothetical protein